MTDSSKTALEMSVPFVFTLFIISTTLRALALTFNATQTQNMKQFN